MGFKLKTLTVENFVVFVPRTSIAFDDTSINYIEGAYKTALTESNGAGKSLIIDAISLALFGKGIRCSYLSDYIAPSNSEGGIYIGLELIDSAGNTLKVERWRRPKSDINKAKVWYNSQCVSTDSTISKIDELIGTYIGLNHSNFISCVFSVMLPGFLKLRPAQRFEMLEQALALKKIESVLKKLNASIKSDSDKLDTTCSAISELSSKIASEKAKLEIYETNAESLTESLATRKAELAECLSTAAAYSKQLSGIVELETKLAAKIEAARATTTKLHALLSILESGKKEKQSSLQHMLSNMKKTGHAFECDVCKSSLNETSIEALKQTYESQITAVDADIATYKARLATETSKESKLYGTQSLIDAEKTKLQNSIAYNKSVLISCERHIESIEEALDSVRTKQADSIIESLQDDFTSLQKTKTCLEKQIKMSSGWKQALSKNGLRLAYIKEEISTLSALASRYATAVYKKPMQIRFFIDDEKDNPSLDFRVNGASAGTFSTGEGRRLEIAMTLSLMSLLKSTGMNLDFLLLDEALDGLSVSGKQTVLSVIDSIAAEYQVVMISHDASIQTRPGHIIQVIKDDSTKISTVNQYTR